VTARSFGGSLVKLLVDIGDERQIMIEDKPEVLGAMVGETVQVGWSADDALLLER